MKDAGIRIRVEKELRTAFVEACRAENRQASDVLRDFMRTYVARRQGGQGDLFSGPVRRPARPKEEIGMSRSRRDGKDGYRA